MICKTVSVNGTVKSKTGYTYDNSGNVISKKLYRDTSSDTDFINYEYTYSSGAYLSEERITGVLNADGSYAASSPGLSNGTIRKTYAYNNLGLMTSSTDQNGNTTTYAYDNNRNVTSITNPDNTHVYYNRNYTSNYVIVIDERGFQTKYQYTPLGLLSSISAFNGQAEIPLQSKTYDSLSRVATVTDYKYSSVTTYTYDYLSRVTHEVVTQQESNATLSDISYTYTDSCDNGVHQKITKTVLGENNAPSLVTTQYTDKMGFVVKTGRILNGNEFNDTYTYDYTGNKLTEKLAYATLLGLDYSTKWEYDYAGRVTKTNNANSPVTGAYSTTTYDALGNKASSSDYAGTVTTYSYDSLGRLLAMNVPIDDSGHLSKTKYYYDAAGNVTSKKVTNNPVGSAETWSQTDYGYNNRGMLANTTVYTNAASGNVITQYGYDGTGNMTWMRTGTSTTTSQDGKLTQYAYDRYGNITELIDPLNQHEYYSYTPQGKPTTKTDRNGNTTSYTYDGLGRLTSTCVTAGGVQSTNSTQYYLTGAKKQEANGTVIYNYKYDSLGRMIETDEPGSIVKLYTYDLANNRTGFTLSNNGTVCISTAYTYDNQNRLLTVNNGGGDTEATYTYDVNGNRASLTYANNTSESYSYNKANWVTELKNYSGTIQISSYTYTYYTDGNQYAKADSINGTTTYTYDGSGRLTNENTAGQQIAYTYDRDSNRTGMTVTGTGACSVAYAYDANNRMTSETKTEGTTQNLTSYYYDPNGNQTAKTFETLQAGTGSAAYSLTNGVANCELYAYNGFNQLVETQLEGKTLTYSYDPSGLRLTKTVNGTTTRFILDGANVALEMSGGTVNATYIRGINLICSTIGGNTRYYLYNAHSDVVHLTNASGAVIKTYNYDAFGNERNIDPNDTNPFRYSGEYYDLETKAYYLRARYYDPTTGRFLSEDPAVAGLNYYTYCANNPIMFIDPSGLAEVGLRAYSEEYGATVSWNGNTGVASVTYNGQTLNIKSTAENNRNGRIYIDDSILNNKFGWGNKPCKLAVTTIIFIDTLFGGVQQFFDQIMAMNISAVYGSSYSSDHYVSTYENQGIKAYNESMSPSTTSTNAYLNSQSINKGTRSTQVTINNDVLGKSRVGSALKLDEYHAFPDIVDNYAGLATKTPIKNGTLYQIEGSLNGVQGRFEWIIDSTGKYAGQVSHRYFVPGGTLNGVPIKP